MVLWGSVFPVFLVLFALALCAHSHPVVAAVMTAVSWCFAVVVAGLVGVVGVLQWVDVHRRREVRRSAREFGTGTEGERAECDRGARLVRNR